MITFIFSEKSAPKMLYNVFIYNKLDINNKKNRNGPET